MGGGLGLGLGLGVREGNLKKPRTVINPIQNQLYVFENVINSLQNEVYFF